MGSAAGAEGAPIGSGTDGGIAVDGLEARAASDPGAAERLDGPVLVHAVRSPRGAVRVAVAERHETHALLAGDQAAAVGTHVARRSRHSDGASPVLGARWQPEAGGALARANDADRVRRAAVVHCSLDAKPAAAVAEHLRARAQAGGAALRRRTLQDARASDGLDRRANLVDPGVAFAIGSRRARRSVR